MGGLVLFGTFGIIVLLFYKEISSHLYQKSLFNKLQTKEGVKWTVLSLGVSLILMGFFLLYAEYIIKDINTTINTPENTITINP